MEGCFCFKHCASPTTEVWLKLSSDGNNLWLADSTTPVQLRINISAVDLNDAEQQRAGQLVKIIRAKAHDIDDALQFIREEPGHTFTFEIKALTAALLNNGFRSFMAQLDSLTRRVITWLRAQP